MSHEIYQAARDLGYNELDAMAYAEQPDLFAADHPDASAALPAATTSSDR